ncbi:hypothetical protein [Paraliomyxa miuraensis]|uniref:hypothetical protein n=1 Tax=Paraliomyxa miuraensis TaxID=376150 RepID=UPI0022502C67|nr:hypothetical protein [Paraliomyxa miuraensis]MCX4241166.1 hypothetical protein [Paraliomyxa miuraensis]
MRGRVVARARRWALAHAACVVVATLVGLYWLPVLWRSSLLNWHVQTAYTQAQLCDWPAWQEGFSSACTGGEWFYRLLERRTIKLPSTLWTSVAAHQWGSAPLFYALPWALHVGSSVLVAALARRMTDRAGLAALAGLAFGLHPAAVEVVVTGQFTQYVFGGFCSLLALWIARHGESRAKVAAMLAAACLCDVTFVVMPLVVLSSVDERRRWWLPCAGALGLGIAVHAVHGLHYPTVRQHHAAFEAVALDERLLRALVIEPVLALRRMLLLWSPGSGPWSMDPPVDEFEGLGPLEPSALLGLAGMLAALAWLARADFGKIARLGVLPIGLLLLDVCIKAGWSDVYASRWSGLRQVYVPVAFVALSAAWCLRRMPSARAIAVAGIATLAWAAWSSHSLAQRTWSRMADDERALSAAVAKLQALGLPAGTTAYLLEVGDARPFSMWQGTLRDRLGDVRFGVVTHDGAAGRGTRVSQAGPRALAIELEGEDASFLRLDRLPSWAGPIEPSESLALYLRRGGQLNLRPIFDRGVLDGRWIPLPGLDGSEVRVASGQDGGTMRLVLRTHHELSDPRVEILVEGPEGWIRDRG